MKFELIIKEGVKERIQLESTMEVPADTFTVADGEKIIETEQFLERLFGYRFHINTVVLRQRKEKGSGNPSS